VVATSLVELVVLGETYFYFYFQKIIFFWWWISRHMNLTIWPQGILFCTPKIYYFFESKYYKLLNNDKHSFKLLDVFDYFIKYMSNLIKENAK
jgi:hypothetical protein